MKQVAIQRYPIVERAAADMQSVTDESFSSAVRRSLQKILREDRGEKVDDSEVAQQQEPLKGRLYVHLPNDVLIAGMYHKKLQVGRIRPRLHLRT